MSLWNCASPSERPRERCLSSGPECLSLRECLALIFQSGPRGVGSLGLAQAILNRPGHGMSEAEQARAFFTAMEVSPIAHLSSICGLGPAHQARLLAAFELGRRYAIFRQKNSGRISLESPTLDQALKRVSASLRQEPQEWIGFVPRYRGDQPLGELCLVERGVRTHVNFDPVELFARILALRPSGFYLFHNHPSGDLRPSSADYELTERVTQVAQKLGIRLLGHGIVSGDSAQWIPL